MMDAFEKGYEDVDVDSVEEKKGGINILHLYKRIVQGLFTNCGESLIIVFK